MLKTEGIIKKIVFGLVVTALPIGLVATPIQGMAETDMGNQASIVHHLHEGYSTSINDGIPKIVVTDGKNVIPFDTKEPSAAWPNSGGKGEYGVHPHDSKGRAALSNMMYSDAFSQYKAKDNIAPYTSPSSKILDIHSKYIMRYPAEYERK